MAVVYRSIPCNRKLPTLRDRLIPKVNVDIPFLVTNSLITVRSHERTASFISRNVHIIYEILWITVWLSLNYDSWKGTSFVHWHRVSNLLTDIDVMNSLSESRQNHTPLMFRLYHEQAEEWWRCSETSGRWKIWMEKRSYAHALNRMTRFFVSYAVAKNVVLEKSGHVWPISTTFFVTYAINVFVEKMGFQFACMCT